MSIDAIYVIHHTHTDVGFTNDQPIFWEIQYRFIDEALRLVDRYADNPYESRFRWTVETTCGLDAWLETASRRDIDRLMAADQAGLLEVMAMQTNNTPSLACCLNWRSKKSMLLLMPGESPRLAARSQPRFDPGRLCFREDRAFRTRSHRQWP